MKYSVKYFLPASLLKVKLTRPFSNRSLELEAKLDTGVDMTMTYETPKGNLSPFRAGGGGQ